MKHILNSNGGVAVGPMKELLLPRVVDWWSREEKRVGKFCYKGMYFGIVPGSDGEMYAVVPFESADLLLLDPDPGRCRTVSWDGIEMGMVLTPRKGGSSISISSGFDI